MKIKNLIIFGTRPEAIKMAPLIHAFNQHSEKFTTKVCLTAQHREMLDQVMSRFELEADYDLNLMRPNLTLNALTSDILLGLKLILEEIQAGYVYGHGDTATTMASAMAACYSGAKICHIDTGLRT